MAKARSRCSQQLLPFWRGKLFVLVLLGFAATSWVITITLVGRRRDGAHRREPADAALARGPGSVGHLRADRSDSASSSSAGFNEAIGVAVFIVVAYMGLNAIVIGVSFVTGARRPAVS